MNDSLLTLRDNRLVEIAKPKNLHIELSVDDQYGMDNLCQHIEEHNRMMMVMRMMMMMMIRAEYGGCGKSCTRESMDSKGAQGPVSMPHAPPRKQLQ